MRWQLHGPQRSKLHKPVDATAFSLAVRVRRVVSLEAQVGGRQEPAMRYVHPVRNSLACTSLMHPPLAARPAHPAPQAANTPLMIFEARYRVLFNTLLDGAAG